MENQQPHFSREEFARYSRHIMMKEFGLEAQKKLKAARVLVVGSGGLGSPALLYLAAAGVGTIGIVDFDVVDDSNLQRQVLFSVTDVGKSKTAAAKERLLALNPFINVETHNIRLTAANAIELIARYDVVADGTDNFPTRYLVNDACVLLNKPNAYASIFQFEGQVSVFNFCGADGQRGPNYRDLYAVPPPPGLVPSCGEAGVLGVLPGIIGSLQALEVIKIITGVGDVLSGRLFIFDALSFETRTLNFRGNPDNPLNGTHPTIHQLIDYEEFCGLNAVQRAVKEISVKELHDMQANGDDFQFIDVRDPNEYEIVNLGALLIPLGEIEAQAERIDRHRKVVIHCKTGNRSARAIRTLEDKFGFENLYNLKAGILGYIDEIQPELQRY